MITIAITGLTEAGEIILDGSILAIGTAVIGTAWSLLTIAWKARGKLDALQLANREQAVHLAALEEEVKMLRKEISAILHDQGRDRRIYNYGRSEGDRRTEP